MKKSIALLSFIVAFSVNSFAQEAKSTKDITPKTATTITESSATIVDQIDALVGLSAQMKADFITLLNMKADALTNAQNETDKNKLLERFNVKMMSALTEEQKTTLTSNTELYKKITSLPK
jgi:hypothetical protein